MAKVKAQTKGAAAPAKKLETVKAGRVVKPAQTEKVKSKELAKKAAMKKIAEPESESDSDSDSSASDSDSDSDSGSDSESEEEVKKPATNGVKGTNGVKAKHDSDSDSSEDDSDSDASEESEDESEDEKAPVTNGKSTKADASEEESFHSAEDKPVNKFKADSDADSDEDSDEDSSEDEAPKANGKKPVDEEDDDDDSDDSDSSEDDSEDEKPATKKRKAEAETTSEVKKAKVSTEKAESNPEGATATLFVGRISWATDDDALYQEFSPFGEIVGCRVVYERDSGRSKGFGYVEYSKVSEAVAAKEAKHNATFDGRTINVDYSQPRNDSNPNGFSGGNNRREAADSRAKKYGDVQGAPQDTLFVGNLSFDATYDMIKEAFEQFGEITRISLPTDPDSGSIKGFGYVGFSSVDEAKAALESLSGMDIAGRPIRLDYATPRQGGNDGGRGGRGGGRGGFDRGGRGGGRGGFDRGGRGGGRGGGFGGGRGGGGGRFQSTNRGGFGDFTGKKITF